MDCAECCVGLQRAGHVRQRREDRRALVPPGEQFDLEYVKGTSWNAYNLYKGQYHILIQVNLDFPVALDQAIEFACHEEYPGHHVYNALLEQALMRERGWVEISIYPLFSPQSFIGEGRRRICRGSWNAER